MKFFLLLYVFASISTFAQEASKDEETAIFSARVALINPVAQLLRIKTTFKNVKFLNKNDRVEFWNENYPDQKCLGVVQGVSNDYVLFKVPQYKFCVVKVHVTVGSNLRFFSKDMQNNLAIAKELVEILLKKRSALGYRKERQEKDLTAYVEKVDAVNKRFDVLRQKLELEWQKELADLEEDKARTFLQFKNTQARLQDLEHKLEAYRIEDHNLTLDRWSLDPDLYFKK